LSSTDSEMSVTSGGTAPNGWRIGGNCSASAGSAGIVMTFSTLTRPSSPRFHSHTDAERSAVEVTTPTNPYVFDGSWAGRSSSTIWCSGPRSISWVCLRVLRFQACRRWPYLLPSSSSPTRPSSTMSGVPHSLVITVSWLRCHQKSYASSCGPRSASHWPLTEKSSWSSRKMPPGPPPSGFPRAET
jgi:hypothetical protein